MKKILIFSHSMEIGGAERALLGLLETINTNEYQVDLFLLRHQGELMPYIPKNIKLLPEKAEYASLAIPLKSVIIKGQVLVAIGRLLGKLIAKRRVKKLELPSDNGVAIEYSHKYTLFAMPMISETEYDLAISFLTPHYFVSDRVKAKKKIAWIHTDYKTLAIDIESELAMWSRYEYIASISDNVTKSFLSVFPSLEKKIVLIENIISSKLIKEQAEAFSVENEMNVSESIKILSIGRFSHAKNFDNIPDICRRILESGLDVKWYLIGYGGEENLIRSKIEECGMAERVIILGKKENPYPYIKACDIYIQPSRYEGKSVSVIEAQIFNKPVVITNYSTASSQLKDGYDGIIVPSDNEGCATEIIRLLNDYNRLNLISHNTMENDYTNSCSIEKIYELLR